MRINRKIKVIIAVFISVVLLSACNQTDMNEKTTPTEPNPEPAWFKIEVTGEDVFETGYCSKKIFNDATLQFTLSTDSEKETEWNIYLVDNELSDTEIEALKKTQPVLTGSGSVQAAYGQWVYIFCNIYSETSEVPSKDVLYFTYPSDYS